MAVDDALPHGTVVVLSRPVALVVPYLYELALYRMRLNELGQVPIVFHFHWQRFLEAKVHIKRLYLFLYLLTC